MKSIFFLEVKYFRGLNQIEYLRTNSSCTIAQLLYYEKEENMGAQIEILQKIKRITEQKRIYVYKAEVRHVYHVANFGFCRILSTNPDGVKSHQNIWLPYIAQYP